MVTNEKHYVCLICYITSDRLKIVGFVKSLMTMIQRVLGRNAAKYNKYSILFTSDSERCLLIQRYNCMLVNIKIIYIPIFIANVQYRNNHSSVAVLSTFRVTSFRHTFSWANSFTLLYRQLSALSIHVNSSTATK